jgi:hypothetical protein
MAPTATPACSSTRKQLIADCTRYSRAVGGQACIVARTYDLKMVRQLARRRLGPSVESRRRLLAKLVGECGDFGV